MKFETNGKGLIQPVSLKDVPLFKHCSGGSIAVTPEFFEAEVVDILLIHRVKNVKSRA